LCTCPSCIAFTHTDTHRAQLNGWMLHPGTIQNHWAQVAAEPKEQDYEQMLSEFTTGLHIEDPMPVSPLLNEEEVTGSRQNNMLEITCK
ncbi:hypothetical protein CROQUDRAFT_27671, partial [Cronartium quercuum f. sp. fusiforme G11]